MKQHYHYLYSQGSRGQYPSEETRDYSQSPQADETKKPATPEFKAQPTIDVVISARDEAHSIGSIISKVKESLSAHSYEIIVVDDGSKDNTSEIARNNSSTVISHPKSLGKGAAMKTGVENSEGDIIVFLDGDGAHNPQDISSILAPLLAGKSDLVIGSRSLPESKVATFPFTRKLANNLASFIISVLVSFLLPLVLLRSPTKYIKITDCTSGFRAIRRGAWQRLNLISRGFQIETEMIYEAAKNGLTITEAPIGCRWDTNFSRLSILSDGMRTLKLLAGKLIGDAKIPTKKARESRIKAKNWEHSKPGSA